MLHLVRESKIHKIRGMCNISEQEPRTEPLVQLA